MQDEGTGLILDESGKIARIDPPVTPDADGIDDWWQG
jgi:hypothetical protein